MSFRSQYLGVAPAILAATSALNLCRSCSSGLCSRQVLVITSLNSGTWRNALSNTGKQQKCFDSWQCSGCRTPSKSKNKIGIGRLPRVDSRQENTRSGNQQSQPSLRPRHAAHVEGESAALPATRALKKLKDATLGLLASAWWFRQRIRWRGR